MSSVSVNPRDIERLAQEHSSSAVGKLLADLASAIRQADGSDGSVTVSVEVVTGSLADTFDAAYTPDPAEGAVAEFAATQHQVHLRVAKITR